MAHQDAESEPWAMPLEGKSDIAFDGLDEQPFHSHWKVLVRKKGLAMHTPTLHRFILIPLGKENHRSELLVLAWFSACRSRRSAV
jgi:hypothetical protein